MTRPYSRIESAADAAVWEERRRERYKKLANKLDIPEEKVEAFVKAYYAVLGAHHDLRMFLQFYFGINRPECMGLEEIPRKIHTTLPVVAHFQKVTLRQMKEFKATQKH